jgi:hypothetical protein
VAGELAGVGACKSCCAGDAWGFAAGELSGIGIPGVCVCGEVAGVGAAIGIRMPGVITCGLGEAEGLGLVALLVGVRLARGAALFLVVARFGLGFAAGALGMTCPSCCGNTLMLSANIKANALIDRSEIFKLPGRFMVPPYMVRQSERCGVPK